MTKSTIEKQYTKLMIHYISNLELCPDQRAALFLDFHENARSYYEELCHVLYRASTEDVSMPIWLNPNGEVYVSANRRNTMHTFLMDCADLPDFNGDIVEHFDHVFTKIYALVGQKAISRPCCAGFY